MQLRVDVEQIARDHAAALAAGRQAPTTPTPPVPVVSTTAALSALPPRAPRPNPFRAMEEDAST